MFTEDSADGTLNGVTPVTLIAAPASGKRRIVKLITICNRDTANAVLTITFVNGANSRRLVSALTLEPGDTLFFGDEGEIFVLNTTVKSVQAVLAGAPATTQPDFIASWGEAP